MKLIRKSTGTLLAVGLFLAFTATMMAQVQSETTTTAGAGTKKIDVERGEVVYVSGNDLIVRMENGEIRHFPNVPESARVTVGGQQLGVHDLKVGMKLERTITTTTTPKLITTVQTVTGTVFHVSPPTSVILTMDNNQNQQFKIPKGQKFNVNGEMVDAFALRKGMKVSATKIVEIPETQVTQHRELRGQMPPPPPPEAPILIAEAAPTPAPAPAPVEEPAPAELPRTASPLPLMGLLGVLSMAGGFALGKIR